jgi:hypothetical protein
MATIDPTRAFKDMQWKVLTVGESRVIQSWEMVQISLLMDLRDQLETMNRRLRVLDCANFLQIPHKLDQIVKHTKPKQKKHNTKTP